MTGSNFGPFKPYAVFLKVGPHFYTFLGTYQYESAEKAMAVAKQCHPNLVSSTDRLIAWPWGAGSLDDGSSPRDELWAAPE